MIAKFIRRLLGTQASTVQPVVLIVHRHEEAQFAFSIVSGLRESTNTSVSFVLHCRDNPIEWENEPLRRTVGDCTGIIWIESRTHAPSEEIASLMFFSGVAKSANANIAFLAIPPYSDAPWSQGFGVPTISLDSDTRLKEEFLLGRRSSA